MSSQEVQQQHLGDLWAKVWHYDNGRARKRALAVAVITAVCLAPIIHHYFSQWQGWPHPDPPRARHPGFPYYWKDTVVIVGLVAVLANAVTGFFATTSARRNIRKQLRYGVFFAILFPAVATCFVERQYSGAGNSPVVITLFLWFPLIIGAVTGVREARNSGITKAQKASIGRAQCDGVTAAAVRRDHSERVFPPFTFYLMHPQKVAEIMWELVWQSSPLFAKWLVLTLSPFATIRLVFFILGS